jgi:hypothetical protein
MATLNEVMKETVDAIREKTGKSELIAPVDFAEEIKGITAGGGESGVECFYYSQKSTALNFRDSWKYDSLLVKVKIDNMVVILPTLSAMDVVTEDMVEAVCIANPMIYDPTLDGMKPFVETIEWFDKYPFITKEEFYDLNA